MGSAGLEAADSRDLAVFISPILALTIMGQPWPPLRGPASLRVWTSSAVETLGMCLFAIPDAVPSQSRLRDSQQFPLELRPATQRHRGILLGALLAVSSRGKPRLCASAVLACYPPNRRTGAVRKGTNLSFQHGVAFFGGCFLLVQHILAYGAGRIRRWTSNWTLTWLEQGFGTLLRRRRADPG